MAKMDGKLQAEHLLTDIGYRIHEFEITPGLAVVLVGDDPASRRYVRNKVTACREAGVRSKVIELPASASNTEVARVIDGLNKDPEVHGIIVQLPLPKHLNRDLLLNQIDPRKDVDGLTPESRFTPCTPAGIMRLLHEYRVPLEGADVCIIGRSQLVGRPLAELLLAENATVTICHSRTKDLWKHTQNADIVIAAAGQPELVTGSMIKRGATLIDVGINRGPDGKLCGDCTQAAYEVAGLYTPVPGGVGPMTVAQLVNNTLMAYWGMEDDY